jgi:transposase
LQFLWRVRIYSGRYYVRDDRPFAGLDPPAAVFFYSRTAPASIPLRLLAGYACILQADAYAGFGELHDGSPRRRVGAMAGATSSLLRAGRSAQGAAGGRGGSAHRRNLRHRAPINGQSAGDRLPVRQSDSKPVVADLETWMRTERARRSRHAATARAIDYILTRCPAFTRFLDDGRICLTNNAAERALRGIALGRRAWLFAGSRPRRRAGRGNVHPDCHRSSSTSPRRPGSPTCSPASPIIPSSGSPNFSPRIGRCAATKPLPLNHPSPRPCGMVTEQ